MRVIITAVFFILIVGWFKNIVHITKLDFEAPYKAEIIRCAAVPLGYGAIVGWIPIKDGKN